MRFLIFLFVILVAIGLIISFVWYQYKNDFLISFIINFINTVLGYIVSKKYFNSSNSMFYTMIYGTMLIRFIFSLSAMLILILNGFVNTIPFFLSFMGFYIFFQIFEISSILNFNRNSNVELYQIFYYFCSICWKWR